MTTKMPVAMTMQQMARQLMLVLEKATPEERERFKQSWLKGAERMNRETARLHEERVSRWPLA